MNIIENIQRSFFSFIEDTFNTTSLPSQANLALNADVKRQQFGDLSSNVALLLAKQLNVTPLDIAQQIAKTYQHNYIKSITIAHPGFINITLTQNVFKELVRELSEQEDAFFTLGPGDPKHTYNVEFVSANPTGPLHFGHGRGGVIGDVLANILQFLGHRVTKEFYINDAGNQIDNLGLSLKIRCQQLLGEHAILPENGYHGNYLVTLAKECIVQHGDAIITAEDSFFANYAKTHILDLIKQTITDFGITFDVWFSETDLHQNSFLAKAMGLLDKHGYLFKQDGALWFKSSAFGDDKDRVVKKSSGQWTYAASDVAYLLNKVTRGFTHLIMVLGHDHHSYVHRLENFKKALLLNHITLNPILYQLVHIKKGKELLQMSKRAGTMITLDDVINAVGKDVARFFFLHRKADAPLEFDLSLALKKTEENPVYYIQYAYVRTKGILYKASQHPQLLNCCTADIGGLTQDDQLLIKKIIALKSILKTIEQTMQTHLLTYYTIELADIFHKYYSHTRIIDLDSIEQSRARLLLTNILHNTFRLTLTLLGVSRPAKM